MGGAVLSADQQRIAFRRIAAWRAGAPEQFSCPVCEAAGLAIVDQSARPHTEWYRLMCPACGLDTTLGVAMGVAPPVLD